MCQLEHVEKMALENTSLQNLWQTRKRIPRWAKNRLYLVKHEVKKRLAPDASQTTMESSLGLQPGDMVRVKSKEQILPTLDGWKMYKGCKFMDEMEPYCGGTYKVMKTVNQILDERDMKMKKCKDMVILEGLICQGSWPFSGCDRACFFFWKDAWLEKIE